MPTVTMTSSRSAMANAVSAERLAQSSLRPLERGFGPGRIDLPLVLGGIHHQDHPVVGDLGEARDDFWERLVPREEVHKPLHNDKSRRVQHGNDAQHTRIGQRVQATKEGNGNL